MRAILMLLCLGRLVLSEKNWWWRLYTGKFFCVGGGGPDANATSACQGDIAADGTVSNVTGSGTYSSAPQAVVTGGGWRTGSAPNAVGNYIIGSSAGVLIYRGYTSGTKTFISSTNPNN